MNWGILFLIATLLIALNVIKKIRITMLGWVAIWWVSIYLLLQFGFRAPLPASILREYMIIATLALLVYIVSDKKRWLAVKNPVFNFLTEPKYNRHLLILLITLPLLVAIKVYLDSKVEIAAPFFGRTVHPAPPDTINFKGKTIDLIRGENPFRKLAESDPEQFAAHVEAGRTIYYQNCHYCHGDSLQGNGLYAYGLDPIPTNLSDPAILPMLQEGFLFWRIAKGGRGLPEEGGPWASAMPAWEDFLGEEDIWNVILFLYDYTGYKPRALEEIAE